MASFGSFETERELFSDHNYTVYRARRNGDPKTEYAVKVFAIQRSEFDTEATSELSPLIGDIERTYTERIAVQQRAAAASKHVAPVFETGQDERGVWYATAYCARSVNRIISGRVALNRESLQHIIQSIAQGALDLKRACGRSHGDILPTNIQISRSEKLADADVLLSDPLPGDQGEAERFELADLRAVGWTILQLVRQREISNLEDSLILPILSGPEWTRLFGKDTDRWLTLCNRLLDPNLSLDQLTLEQLVTTLEGLKPKSGISPRLVLAGVAGAVLLGAGGLIALWATAYRTIEVTSDPPGAMILVDRAEKGKAPVKLRLKKGTYRIEARHDDLRLLEQTTNLVVQSGSAPALRFRFPYGSVAIFSQPSGATIRRDGVKLGETPADGRPFVVPIVAAGAEVKYQLSLDQYIEREVRGVVTNGQQLEFRETLPRSDVVGTLEVESTPRGAKVFDGEKLLLTTPNKALVEARAYELTVVYSNWPTQRVSATVRKGAETNVNVYFPSARISLDSQPSEATVFMGTNSLGTTPLSTLLPVGPVSFRFERVGFEPTNMTAQVRDRAPLLVKATLISTNGTFDLTSDPLGAVILDNSGKELGRTAAGKSVNVTLRPGAYQFTARTPGLDDRVESLTVGKSSVLKHTFQFDYGRVQLESVPPGAAISIDGRALGAAPAPFVQKPGTKITYQLAAPDYVPTNVEVVLASRETRTVSVKLMPEPVAAAFNSDPPGAQFYGADGAPLTVTRSAHLLPWGTHVITAKHALHPSLDPVKETVLVKKGAANVHEFKFNYGTVTLETDPPDATAEIFELGKLIARTPTNLYLRPGRVDFQMIYENQTNRFGTNVIQNTRHTLTGKFEVRRDYTNSVGMVMVRVSKDLYAGKFEVTHQEYLALMPQSKGMDGRQNEPVSNVKWNDALQFCKTLSEKEAELLAKQKLSGWEYSLPTEADWLGLVGTDTNQLTESVFSYNSQSKSQDINPNRKSYNKLGIYDLFGSVEEWCLGANSEPITMGGNYVSRYDRIRGPEAMLKNVPRRPGASVPGAIDEGVPTIGFRCVIKPKRPQ